MADEHTMIRLVNPLPLTLHHYESEIVSLLGEIPNVCVRPDRDAISGEIADATGRGLARANSAVQLARRPASIAREPATLTLVTWPIFGLYEPLMWAGTARRHRVAIVVHDPTPLRPSLGMGQVARTLGGWATRLKGLDIVVHSVAAQREIASWGWPVPVLLRHPVLGRVDGRPDGSHQRVVVVGQYKPARDTALLADLAEPLRSAGFDPCIAGYGWPAIQGWRVQSRRLSEAELNSMIDSATAVLIPYKNFYQSGIAVRAIERGKPIVGPRHEFLADLYGGQWPGLVAGSSTGEWLTGVVAAAAVPEAVKHAHARYLQKAAQEWASYLQDASRK